MNTSQFFSMMMVLVVYRLYRVKYEDEAKIEDKTFEYGLLFKKHHFDNDEAFLRQCNGNGYTLL